MKIGVDIDSVLCELTAPLMWRVNNKYGTNLTRDDIKEWNWKFDLNGYHIDGYSEIKEALDDYFFALNLPAIDGGKEMLDFREFLGDEILLITSRNKSRAPATKEWVKRNIGNYEIKFTEGDKNGYDVDVLIDDAPHHTMDFAKKGKFTILFDQPWNQGVEHPNILRIKSWDDLYLVWPLIESWVGEHKLLTERFK